MLIDMHDQLRLTDRYASPMYAPHDLLTSGLVTAQPMLTTPSDARISHSMLSLTHATTTITEASHVSLLVLFIPTLSSPSRYPHLSAS